MLRVAIPYARLLRILFCLFVLSVKAVTYGIFVSELLRTLNYSNVNVIHGSRPQRWILSANGPGRHPMRRPAFVRIKERTNVVDTFMNDSDISKIPILELVTEDPLVPINLQPYSSQVSNFIVTASANQSNFRANLIWFHAPKTSSTICTTLFHLSCPEFAVPDNNHMTVFKSCAVPTNLTSSCVISNQVRDFFDYENETLHFYTLILYMKN